MTDTPRPDYRRPRDLDKKQLNVRASALTIQQLNELADRWGTSQTETLTVLIDRAYQAETRKRRKNQTPNAT